MSHQKEEKARAALKALEEVQDGMVVGLGTGSTAAVFIEALAAKVNDQNWQITGVATSKRSAELAQSLGLTVKDIDEVSAIDVTIDGADEVDPELNGIKGGGAALLYEKVVALRSKKNVWVVDQSKAHDLLGTFPLPVEVIEFGAQQVYLTLAELNLRPKFRMKNESERAKTDSGHNIIDVRIDQVDDKKALAKTLKAITGVVEHGLFLDICDKVIIGTDPIQTLVKKTT
ncbi:ribose-5-phosphate isomerase RpiA [Fructobacillus sp. M1-13]|uniref:Ribose-5-phosphate isomerase A n=1 Tax=Fructobacillus papyriferae TaxID=2713171 RepID=A0ABS5QQW3_9LACO|nr:ribose-5-phosphate isomerase RpiA [Fructobacillus papyriferae]MBS9335590.1 ribose-5-phosphate isomerase RpiA [Fructobacillus papyriferae]MCD2159321.1 ribose-5-phosphate isomerase RpiA [Fructobacillus papyriferae]